MEKDGKSNLEEVVFVNSEEFFFFFLRNNSEEDTTPKIWENIDTKEDITPKIGMKFDLEDEAYLLMWLINHEFFFWQTIVLAWARSLAGKEFSVVLDEDANISLMMATSDINLFTDCYKWHYFVLLSLISLFTDACFGYFYRYNLSVVTSLILGTFFYPNSLLNFDNLNCFALLSLLEPSQTWTVFTHTFFITII